MSLLYLLGQVTISSYDSHGIITTAKC